MHLRELIKLTEKNSSSTNVNLAFSYYQKVLTFNAGFFALISGLSAQLVIFQFYESVTRCTGALDNQHNSQNSSQTLSFSTATGESCNSTELTKEQFCGLSEAVDCGSQFCDQIEYAMDDTGLYSFPMEMNLHCESKWLVSFILSMPRVLQFSKKNSLVVNS